MKIERVRSNSRIQALSRTLRGEQRRTSNNDVKAKAIERCAKKY